MATVDRLSQLPVAVFGAMTFYTTIPACSALSKTCKLLLERCHNSISLLGKAHEDFERARHMLSRKWIEMNLNPLTDSQHLTLQRYFRNKDNAELSTEALDLCCGNQTLLESIELLDINLFSNRNEPIDLEIDPEAGESFKPDLVLVRDLLKQNKLNLQDDLTSFVQSKDYAVFCISIPNAYCVVDKFHPTYEKPTLVKVIKDKSFQFRFIPPCKVKQTDKGFTASPFIIIDTEGLKVFYHNKECQLYKWGNGFDISKYGCTYSYTDDDVFIKSNDKILKIDRRDPAKPGTVYCDRFSKMNEFSPLELLYKPVDVTSKLKPKVCNSFHECTLVHPSAHGFVWTIGDFWKSVKTCVVDSAGSFLPLPKAFAGDSYSSECQGTLLLLTGRTSPINLTSLLTGEKAVSPMISGNFKNIKLLADSINTYAIFEGKIKVFKWTVDPKFVCPAPLALVKLRVWREAEAKKSNADAAAAT